MTMRRIAVDAMGTDAAPQPEVEGAISAAREGRAEVLLVGPQELLKRELARRDTRGLPIELVHASEAITMEDGAAKAFRRKRRMIFFWAIGAGLLVSAVLACMLYLFSGL